jgi:hypothetical protein
MMLESKSPNELGITGDEKNGFLRLADRLERGEVTQLDLSRFSLCAIGLLSVEIGTKVVSPNIYSFGVSRDICVQGQGVNDQAYTARAIRRFLQGSHAPWRD